MIGAPLQVQGCCDCSLCVPSVGATTVEIEVATGQEWAGGRSLTEVRCVHHCDIARSTKASRPCCTYQNGRSKG